MAAKQQICQTRIENARNGGIFIELPASECAGHSIYLRYLYIKLEALSHWLNFPQRHMQHVFTVLFFLCLPHVPPPNSLSLLLSLHARIVIEAFSHFIRLCCRLEDPTNRPSLHWGCLSPLWPPRPLLSSSFPVQAEIYAHMLSTLFALKGGWVCSHFGGWLLILSLARQYEGLLLLLLSCLPVGFPLLPFF